jgi:hypothetical protein
MGGDAPNWLEDAGLAHDEPIDWPAGPAPAFADPWIVATIALTVGVLVDSLASRQPPGLGLVLGLSITIIAVAATRALLDLEHPRSIWGFAGCGVVFAGFVVVLELQLVDAQDRLATERDTHGILADSWSKQHARRALQELHG